ncbi:MAG: hypothetical protein AABO58_10660 [Acidobacteriota bacterium]
MRTPYLLVLGSLLLLAAVPASACSTLLGYRDTTFYITQVRVTTSNFPDDTAISAAAGYWNSGCGGGSSYDYPSIGSGTCSGSGCLQVTVNYVSGVSQTLTGGCAAYQDNQSGQTTGGTITVYESDILGRACSQEWVNSLEHEFGHVLGLGHPSNGEVGGACFGHVMGNHAYATGYSGLDIEDCNHIDEQWYTPIEEQVDQQQADLQTCNSSCLRQCEYTGNSYYCPPGESPIIIDLDDDGFTLTNAENGVSFDLNADRRAERIGWTSAAGGDAFLCRDRNGDGRIGDGRELFGNATPLANGHKAPNGFVALGEFDTAALGGNGDGQLDDRDRLWGTLLLWLDSDHDGISQPSELIALSVAGVRSIDFHYVRLNYTDENGNTFRFRAKAMVRDRKGKYHNAKIYDVFLSTGVNASGEVGTQPVVTSLSRLISPPRAVKGSDW